MKSLLGIKGACNEFVDRYPLRRMGYSPLPSDKGSSEMSGDEQLLEVLKAIISIEAGKTPPEYQEYLILSLEKFLQVKSDELSDLERADVNYLLDSHRSVVERAKRSDHFSQDTVIQEILNNTIEKRNENTTAARYIGNRFKGKKLIKKNQLFLTLEKKDSPIFLTIAMNSSSNAPFLIGFDDNCRAKRQERLCSEHEKVLKELIWDKGTEIENKQRKLDIIEANKHVALRAYFAYDIGNTPQTMLNELESFSFSPNLLGKDLSYKEVFFQSSREDLLFGIRKYINQDFYTIVYYGFFMGQGFSNEDVVTKEYRINNKKDLIPLIRDTIIGPKYRWSSDFSFDKYLKSVQKKLGYGHEGNQWRSSLVDSLISFSTDNRPKNLLFKEPSKDQSFMNKLYWYKYILGPQLYSRYIVFLMEQNFPLFKKLLGEEFKKILMSFIEAYEEKSLKVDDNCWNTKLLLRSVIVIVDIGEIRIPNCLVVHMENLLKNMQKDYSEFKFTCFLYKKDCSNTKASQVVRLLYGKRTEIMEQLKGMETENDLLTTNFVDYYNKKHKKEKENPASSSEDPDDVLLFIRKLFVNEKLVDKKSSISDPVSDKIAEESIIGSGEDLLGLTEVSLVTAGRKLISGATDSELMQYKIGENIRRYTKVKGYTKLEGGNKWRLFDGKVYNIKESTVKLSESFLPNDFKEASIFNISKGEKPKVQLLDLIQMFEIYQNKESMKILWLEYLSYSIGSELCKDCKVVFEKEGYSELSDLIDKIDKEKTKFKNKVSELRGVFSDNSKIREFSNRLEKLKKEAEDEHKRLDKSSSLSRYIDDIKEIMKNFEEIFCNICIDKVVFLEKESREIGKIEPKGCVEDISLLSSEEESLFYRYEDSITKGYDIMKRGAFFEIYDSERKDFLEEILSTKNKKPLEIEGQSSIRRKRKNQVVSSGPESLISI